MNFNTDITNNSLGDLSNFIIASPSIPTWQPNDFSIEVSSPIKIILPDKTECYVHEHIKQQKEILERLDKLTETVNEIIDMLRYSPPSELQPNGGSEYQKGKQHFNANID